MKKFFFLSSLDYSNSFLLLIICFCTLVVSGCIPINYYYRQPAYQPKNVNHVHVKVSLKKQVLYVLEDDRPLLVTACSVGKKETPTPHGNFIVTNKQISRRSHSYGFALINGMIFPAKSRDLKPDTTYIGYPLAYWVEFFPGYGFHQGLVWPRPHSHGCIVIHRNNAGDFYNLVKKGTQISIEETQPEDLTFGKRVPRPQDYYEFPYNFLIKDDFFSRLVPPNLRKSPSTY